MKRVYEHTADQGAIEYLTPKWIIDALGPFDLDPCASNPRPFDCAKVNLTGPAQGGECGLETPWKGFVWCNPPYGRRHNERAFVQKLANHKAGGIALVNVKPATKLWQDVILPHASAILLLRKRIVFLNPSGESTGGTFGNQCLIAFGQRAHKKISTLREHGHIILVENQNGY